MTDKKLSADVRTRPTDMTDEELMDAFYTHPQRMAGSALHRHDNVHRQLAAFTELLRRVQSQHADDHLRQMLNAVTVGVPDFPRRPGRQQSNHGAGDVTGLTQLRLRVNALRSARSKRGGIQREQCRTIVNYFDQFFDDLHRLRELKRYFHERIYACLHEQYYQPDVEPETGTASSSNDAPRGHRGSAGSSGGGRPLATVLDQSDNDAPSLNGRPLAEIVHELWVVNRDWDLVVSAGDKDASAEFDEEPPRNGDRFASIISIVPNWVELGFKALQLAKIWWTTASRIYSQKTSTSRDVPRAFRASDQTLTPRRVEEPDNDDDDCLDDEATSLQEELSTLSDCAYQINVELVSVRDELTRVRQHGERVETLYGRLKDAEQLETEARKHREDILAKSKSDKRDFTDVSFLRQLDRARADLEVAQYRVRLLRGDLELESGIRLGDGICREPLEDELRALEEQLGKTLKAKQTAEDKLQTLRTRRTSFRESEDNQGRTKHRSDPVDFTRAGNRSSNPR